MKKILGILFMTVLVLPQFSVFAQDVVVDPSLPVSECVALTRTLKYGNTSLKTEGEVSALKRFLNKFGYLDLPVDGDVDVDDVFDRATQKALKTFQKDYNILVYGLPSGVTESLTRRQIKILSCEREAFTSATMIRVLSQNNKENYKAGTLMKISWNTNVLTPRDVRVSVHSMQKGSNMVMSTFVLDGSKEKTLRIPENMPAGSYKVMIHEVLKDSVFGVSGVFTIGSMATPSIDRMSGPASLMVNQSGAWSLYTSNPNGGRLTFNIDWADGSKTNLFDVEGSEDIVFSHTYKNVGNYKINFKITDRYGKFAEVSTFVNVIGKEVINPIIYGISGSSSVVVNKEASFLVLGSAPAGETLTYSVSWGESESIVSPEQNSPQFFHTYKEAGEYTVVFYVYSSNGGVAKKEYKVKVMGAVVVLVLNDSTVNSAF